MEMSTQIQYNLKIIKKTLDTYTFLCVYSSMKTKEVFMLGKKILNQIEQKLKQHHELYRFPVKAELWEDIFDQVINGKNSNWNGGGHSSGADVISENSDGTLYQNKSGDINFNKGTIKWNGHRTTSKKTIDEKIKFIL